MKTGSKNDSKCVFPSMKFLKLFRFLVRSPLINFMRTCSFFFFADGDFGRLAGRFHWERRRQREWKWVRAAPFHLSLFLSLSLSVVLSFFLSFSFLLSAIRARHFHGRPPIKTAAAVPPAPPVRSSSTWNRWVCAPKKLISIFLNWVPIVLDWWNNDWWEMITTKKLFPSRNCNLKRLF